MYEYVFDESGKKPRKESETSTVIKKKKKNVIPLYVEAPVICLGFWYIFGCMWIQNGKKNHF